MTTSETGSTPAAGRATRVALIGCGKMGLQHVRAIRQVAGAQLVGVADPAAQPGALQAALPAGVRIFTEPAALLDELKPDVVHIVTPPGTHMALASQVLTSGAHAYVEKPFTPSAEEARRLFELAAERGLQLCAGHQLLFEPPMQRLKAALPLVGTIVSVESYMAFRTVRRNITPVDQVKDVLPHAVYLLVDAMGEGGDNVELTALEAEARGEVHARIRCGAIRGSVTLTLNGRPVQQWVKVVGSNGTLQADFITGAVVRLVGPGASAPAVLLNPYIQSWQVTVGATAGFWRRLRSRASYPGLSELFERFYESARLGSAPPMQPSEVIRTVSLCEQVGSALDNAQDVAEAEARERLGREALQPRAPAAAKGTVLVTGGSGFLGKRVSAELRQAGYQVRVVGRGVVPYQARLAGVEYVRADLARPLPPPVLESVRTVVHCAAETAGGKQEHEANSVGATRNLLEAAAAAHVETFVHVSSVAVLTSGRGRPVDERTSVDPRPLDRGPYVWGKTESEAAVTRAGGGTMQVRIVRPGPLVDFSAFNPPGRLGRELGPLYVAVGPRRAPLALCDVGTAARVLRWYVDNPGSAPPVLNLLEAVPPQRRELVARLRAARPELGVIWLPSGFLRVASWGLTMAQRIFMRGRQPIDVYAAFASEQYATGLAANVIGLAEEAATRQGTASASDPLQADSSKEPELARGEVLRA